ncbi:thioredoxin family protein [Litchfieldia alkalitelluris]|uniref:thioredoxin family protein n=1 Tax=Litchfieldia alkalitelluris TaxID=304268 RepID=UPI0009963F7C|nr:thioredoxin family protein [Litchfieldia alkalitelluris]
MIEWNKEVIESNLERGGTIFIYLYTPLCGTCQLAKKMLDVVEQTVPNLEIGMCDLNYFSELAEKWEIKSVPCLVKVQDREIVEQIYAFQSVQYLYSILK